MLNNKIFTAFLLSLVILTQGFLGNVCACKPSTAIEHVSQSTNVTKTENKKGLSLKQKIGIGLGCAGIATMAGICMFGTPSFSSSESSFQTVESPRYIFENSIEYMQLNIAVIGSDENLKEKVISKISGFTQKIDDHENVFLVKPRVGKSFAVKFYNINDDNAEVISECHYALCPFNSSDKGLNDRIVELGKLEEFIKSKNYLCEIIFITVYSDSMSDEENLSYSKKINAYATKCEKEYRWNGNQDFSSIYLGENEEREIPELLRHIAEWGEIRVNDFKNKLGKTPIVFRQTNFV